MRSESTTIIARRFAPRALPIIIVASLPSSKTERYGAVLRTRDSGERGRCTVLSRRACTINVQQGGRSAFAKLCVVFGLPSKCRNFVAKRVPCSTGANPQRARTIIVVASLPSLSDPIMRPANPQRARTIIIVASLPKARSNHRHTINSSLRSSLSCSCLEQ